MMEKVSKLGFNKGAALVILVVPIFWVGLSQVQASSHRESPLIGNSYDANNSTDFYAFVGYNADGKEMVNVVAEFLSIENNGVLEVAPTAVNSGEQTLYTIYFDDNSDVKADYAVSVNLTALSNSADTGISTKSGAGNSPSNVASDTTSSVTIPDCPEQGQISIRKFPHRIVFDPVSGKFDLVRRQLLPAKTTVSLEIPASCVAARGRTLNVWSSSSQLSAEGAIGVSRPDASPSNVQQLNVANKTIEKIDGGSMRETVLLPTTRFSIENTPIEKTLTEVGR